MGNYTTRCGKSQVVFVFLFHDCELIKRTCDITEKVIKWLRSFDLVDDVGLMPDMTASVFEHITAEGHHVISFDEIVYLFFSYFHKVSIPHYRVKVKGKRVFILFFYSRDVPLL